MAGTTLLFTSPLTGLTPFYVVLAMPFTYRAIDTGVRAIDLRTLVDASRSLGASWFVDPARVVLPNVHTAVLGAFPDVALVPRRGRDRRDPALHDVPGRAHPGRARRNAGVSVALSIISLLFTFLLLFSSRSWREEDEVRPRCHRSDDCRRRQRALTAQWPRVAGPPSASRSPVVQRHFGDVTALAGLDLEIARRRAGRPARPVRAAARRPRCGSSAASTARTPGACSSASATSRGVPAQQARHGHGLPGLQPVPEHGRAHQRRLRAAHARAGQERPAGARRRAARARRARASAADRYPHQLSGGQQQRVAHRPRARDRAHACCCSTSRSRRSTPACAPQLRAEIRSLQQRLGITTLFVTHDQSEALSMADRVGVMQRRPARAARHARRRLPPARPRRSWPSSSAR